MMGLNILPSSGLEKAGNRSSLGQAAAASVVASQGYKTLWEDASTKDTGNLYFGNVLLFSCVILCHTS